MRSARSLLLVCLSMVAAACGVGTEPAALAIGSFQGSWDGVPWTGRSYAVLQGDTLLIVGHRPDPDYYYDEYISAQVVFSGPTTYQVAAPAGRLWKIVGGDAGYSPEASGTVVIRTYDPQTRTVAGSIELSALHAGERWRADGEFRARVYNSIHEVPSVR